MPVNRTVNSWQTAATGLRLTIRAWLARFSRPGHTTRATGSAPCPIEYGAPSGITPYREIVKGDIFRIVQELMEERERDHPDLDAINSRAKELITLVKLVRSHEDRQSPSPPAVKTQKRDRLKSAADRPKS